MEMATKREKNGAWEYTIRRKGILPKPVYLRFKDPSEGDEYVKRLEALLDRGIVPTEFRTDAEEVKTLADVIDAYQRALHVPSSDAANLAIVRQRNGGEKITALTYQWAESWVLTMKRIYNHSPSTIRHYVGATARCIDWMVRKDPGVLPINPLRLLPKRYATYNQSDVESLGKDQEPKTDQERDRRIAEEEEESIRIILGGKKPDNRQRPLELNYQPALVMLFDLALESAMRLREMFTLDVKQVSFTERTIFLDKTKNGDKRQVPISSVANNRLKEYISFVQVNSLEGWKFKDGLLFPWWDGTKIGMKKTTAKLSRQYARIFDAAKCGDLVFHDTRHEATCRLYERTKLSDIEISLITGHKDPRMLRRYANLRGSHFAGKLW